jgi:hypothetical protein
MQPEEAQALEPTFATLPGIASINSVYAGYDCGEECGGSHLEHKGEPLDGVMGWGEDDDEVEWWLINDNEETGEQL